MNVRVYPTLATITDLQFEALEDEYHRNLEDQYEAYLEGLCEDLLAAEAIRDAWSGLPCHDHMDPRSTRPPNIAQDVVCLAREMTPEPQTGTPAQQSRSGDPCDDASGAAAPEER